MYKYLFGPVPSRRLGSSLGIDLMPLKTCTLNCIYCECGRTTNLTLERKEWVPVDGVIAELEHYFAHSPQPEFVTFSGSGEPTLHSKIGEILNFLKEQRGYFQTAVLTNGTLLFDAEVRRALSAADVVIPSLDAAHEKTFKRINKPHPALKLPSIIDGMIQFRKEFSGKMYLEIFIVPGINDGPSDLMALKEAILAIKPDRVQLNTLDRPGHVSSIRAATETELKSILDYWQLPQVEIISRTAQREQSAAFRQDIESAILETIARRPCTLDDLQKILGLHINEINKYLDILEQKGKIRVVQQTRGFFYRLN